MTRERDIETDGINARGPRDLAGLNPAESVRVPIAPRFNWRRQEIRIDVGKLLRTRGNGLRIQPLLDDMTALEGEYQRWLLRVGANGTRPEFAVYDALERMGLRAQASTPPGADFRFQVPVNGGRQQGGAILDFLVESVSPPVAIRVQGEFFHFADDESQESDIIQRRMIESLGFTVVDILAQDTLNRRRTDEGGGYALLGMELDTSGRLGVFR